MRTTMQFFLIVLLSMVFGITATDSFAKEFAAFANKKITGCWKFKDPENGPQRLTFKKDGTYQLDFEDDGKKDIWGHYRVSRDWVIMNDVGGDFVFDCGQQGAYTYRIEDNILTFNIMGDQCPSRSQAMSVQWERLKKPRRVIEPPIMMKI